MKTAFNITKVLIAVIKVITVLPTVIEGVKKIVKEAKRDIDNNPYSI